MTIPLGALDAIARIISSPSVPMIVMMKMLSRRKERSKRRSKKRRKA